MQSLVIGAVLAHLLVRPWSQTNEPLAERVAADFRNADANAALRHYAVRPMSGFQRLPDVYPEDAKPGAPVGIVLAKDEYEPGSFLLYPRQDLGKVQLSLGTFKTGDGRVFPAEDLDLKVVKVWYQNRNAWYSYFGDTGFKLVPELLLNDEELIRVDTEKEANYARLKSADGKTREWWLNPPRQLCRVYWDHYRGGEAFRPMGPEFADADILQPVTLGKGAFKQFFLTAHARKTTPAGLYRGEVEIKGEGERRIGSIPVEIRVLDFELPQPMCYFDDKMPFYVTFYGYDCLMMIMERNGGDPELAKRQFLAVLKDRVAHGQDITWFRWGFHNAEADAKLAAMKASGCRDDLYVSMAPTISRARHSQKLVESFNLRSLEATRRLLGPTCEIWGMYGDEPTARALQDMRHGLRNAQAVGFKFILAGSDNVFRKGGYQYDWHNINRWPESDETTRLWNQLGTKPHVAWYATQHVGVENPDFNRRQNGMAAYLSNYSSLCNYAHHFGSYNDDSEGYKPMVFAYGQYKGVLGTLQWEGFREGLDDIRYATMMVKLARRAAVSKDVDVRYEGNKALMFLASFRRDADDLDECRYEMINWIFRLRKALGE